MDDDKTLHGEIVVQNKQVKYITDMMSDKIVTAESLQAINILLTPDAPDYAIQTHPGKGGKVMSYLSHVWVTKQLREAFGQMWGMTLSNPMAYDDSAAILVTLYVDFPRSDGTVYRRTVTEIGAFDGGGGKMTKAMMLASATSRGLVKCTYRMFGLGENLYAETPEPTRKSSWDSIRTMGIKRGLTEERIKEVIKSRNITYETLLERFVEAYQAVYEATMDRGDIPEM